MVTGSRGGLLAAGRKRLDWEENREGEGERLGYGSKQSLRRRETAGEGDLLAVVMAVVQVARR